MGQKHYVIASNTDAARIVSRLMRTGEIPVIYETPEACLDSWRSQPSPMQARYHVWGVEWESDSSCLITQLTAETPAPKE